MTLDDLLDRQYDYDKYNCGHFVVEVWDICTGQRIDDVRDTFVNGDVAAYAKLAKQRERLDGPVSPCVCLMRSTKLHPHVGVFIDGKVLHLTEAGPKFDELTTLRLYYQLSFYR